MSIKKITLTLCIGICAMVVPAYTADATLGDFLETYVDHLDDDIPPSYQYIDVYFTNIVPDSKLHAVFQKAIYLNMIANLPIEVDTSLLITQESLAQVMRAHRGRNMTGSLDHVSRNQMHQVIDSLPDYRAYYCGLSPNPTHTIDVSDFALTKAERFPILDDVYQRLTTSYLYRDKLTSDKLITAAIQGMTSQVDDEYTVYMEPVDAKLFNTALSQEYSGIGVVIEPSDEGLVVVSPFVGSPAALAGLKPGDVITHADGKDIRPYGKDATKFIIGPVDTPVRITYLRGGVLYDVSIMRKMVKLTMVNEKQLNGAYYISLANFGFGAGKEVEKALQNYLQTPSQKLIIDLRNNPGGSVSEAEKILDMLLPVGTETYIMRATNSSYSHVTKTTDTRITNSNIILLINKGSASASEIIAKVLQERGVATVVGETSFGKGTAQAVVDYADGSSLKYTIYERQGALSMGPVNGVGVVPDYQISNSDQTTDHDEQLEYALDL